jgi:Eukaryotic aspartyl protease/MBG domain (YGX type)/Bacterial Ig-like domain (group 3)
MFRKAGEDSMKTCRQSAFTQALRARKDLLLRVCTVLIAFSVITFWSTISLAQNVWYGLAAGEGSLGCAVNVYTVPNGASYVQITAIGQAGSAGTRLSGGDAPGTGGNGGIVTVVASISPGQTLYAAPTSGLFFVSTALSAVEGGGVGGFGSVVATTDPTNACNNGLPPDPGTLVVVAAGGGGGAAGALGTGGSGGAAGVGGGNGGSNSADDGAGGDPGTQTNGGVGGARGSVPDGLPEAANGSPGGPGDYFAGGIIGVGASATTAGGGGAGYYGGGGGGGGASFLNGKTGGGDGGGGGGSNYVAPSIPSASPGDGQVVGTISNRASPLRALVRISPIFSTTTTITSSPNPSSLGQPVTITVTVASSEGSYPSGGNVDITDGPNTIATIALSKGVVTYATSSFSAGPHPLQGIYHGYSSDGEIDQPSFSPSQNIGGVLTPYTQIVGSAPTLTSIVENPGDAGVYYGGAVGFEAQGSGNPVPTIQWQVSRDGGASFATIPGETASGIFIASAQISQNDYLYRALFTNAAGTVATSAARLLVFARPLTIAADNRSMLIGGSEPALTASYTGLVAGDGPGSLNGTLVCVTTPAMITSTTPVGNYPINCSGQSSGNYAITYDAGTLQITAPSAVITATPMPNQVPVSSSYAISASGDASGNPIAYSVDVSTTDGSCTVSATGVVSFVKVNRTSGTATCKIDLNQAAGGSYPAAAQVQLTTQVVYQAPYVISETGSYDISAGDSTSFTLALGGSPAPTLQWYLSTDSGATFNAITGATSTTLAVSNVTAYEDGYFYVARFTNNPGQILVDQNTDSQTEIRLVVEGAPVVKSQPQNAEADANTGVIVLKSMSGGQPDPTYLWQYSTDGGMTWFDNGTASPTFGGPAEITIPTDTTSDGYMYRVVFANGHGSVTSNVVVVHVDYHAIGDPSDASVSAGQTASFSVVFAGYPEASVRWQSAPANTTNFTDIVGATALTYTVPSATLSQTGLRYRAMFTQAGALDGTVATPSNFATLTVTRASPTLAATAEGSGGYENRVTDKAMLSAGASPTGTMTFTLFGAGDSSCSAAPLFTSTISVSGNSNYASASYSPDAVGTYNWTVAYSGDANNNAASLPCASPGQSVTLNHSTSSLAGQIFASGFERGFVVPLASPNVVDVLYTAQVTIGNQDFAMYIDTGSTTVGIGSADCTSGCTGVSPLYAPSSSAAATGNTVSTTYEDGSGFSGSVYSDTVSFGNGSQSASIDLVAINQASLFFGSNNDYQGILGLGAQQNAEPNTTGYVPALNSAGLDDILAFELCDNTGANAGVMWLGTDGSPNGAQYTPLLQISNNNPFYAINVDALSLGSNSIVTSASDTFESPVLDTGTSLFYVPSSVYGAFVNALEASDEFKAIFGTNTFSPEGCITDAGVTDAQVAGLPPIVLSLPNVTSGQPDVTIQASALDTYLYTAGAGEYCLAIQNGGTTDPSTFGDAFMQAFHVVIDVSSSRVGFAAPMSCAAPANRRIRHPSQITPHRPPRPVLP